MTASTLRFLPRKPLMFVTTAIAAATLVCAPAAQATTTGYIWKTAPDALSKSILRHVLKAPDEGAASQSSDDMLRAIHDNFPKTIEQSVAAMPPSTARNWVDQLNELEFEHLAQLYVNANWDMGREGQALNVLALRLDGKHLGRVSKYFGYEPVRAAVAKMAPQKLSAFDAASSTSYASPTPGAALSVPFRLNGQFVGGGANGYQEVWTPQISMSFEQLYIGFRAMQVGSWATQAAVYEMATWAGQKMVPAFGYGYAFGTGITYVMREYEPAFYYDTFVPAVGNSVTYVQNFVGNTYRDYVDGLYYLGQLQSATFPVYGVPGGAVAQMADMSGDYYTESGYNSWVGGGGSRCPCFPEWPY